MTSPVRVLALTFGTFPEVDRLNPRFAPGHRKLKLTLDIDPEAVADGVDPRKLPEALVSHLPTLGEHACRGDDGEVDRAAELAHLLEHVLIDLIHYTARMRSCSGITCGYREPATRFDLFVEATDPALARLCASLGVEMVDGMLRGMSLSSVTRHAAVLARYLHDHPHCRITEPAAAGIIDTGHAAAAETLRVLGDAGFIHETEMCVNFSGTPSWVKEMDSELDTSSS